MKCVGFALLLWIPALLQAQTSSQSCTAPSLNRGYFVPVQETYPHKTKISYACDEGFTPAERGWWATSTCRYGNWVSPPRCIEILPQCSEPPKIPNAVIINQDYWEAFAVGSEVVYQCKDEYVTEEQTNNKSVFCRAGKWTYKSSACYEPPKIPNAVIINQRPQEVYSENSEVHYQCEEGHDTDPPNADKSITCRAGVWTQGPSCTVSVDCVFDPARYYGSGQHQIINMKEGDVKKIDCRSSWPEYWALVWCKDRRTLISDCCHPDDIRRGECRFINFK